MTWKVIPDAEMTKIDVIAKKKEYVEGDQFNRFEKMAFLKI